MQSLFECLLSLVLYKLLITELYKVLPTHLYSRTGYFMVVVCVWGGVGEGGEEITSTEIGNHHQCQIEEKISQLILSHALFYIEELNSDVE